MDNPQSHDVLNPSENPSCDITGQPSYLRFQWRQVSAGKGGARVLPPCGRPYRKRRVTLLQQLGIHVAKGRVWASVGTQKHSKPQTEGELAPVNRISMDWRWMLLRKTEDGAGHWRIGLGDAGREEGENATSGKALWSSLLFIGREGSIWYSWKQHF